jgi:hypothetical protein
MDRAKDMPEMPLKNEWKSVHFPFFSILKDRSILMNGNQIPGIAPGLCSPVLL